MFMLKQHQGDSISSRTDDTRNREMALMAITHNILIVLPKELFYKAFLTPFLPPFLPFFFPADLCAAYEIFFVRRLNA